MSEDDERKYDQIRYKTATKLDGWQKYLTAGNGEVFVVASHTKREFEGKPTSYTSETVAVHQSLERAIESAVKHRNTALGLDKMAYSLGWSDEQMHMLGDDYRGYRYHAFVNTADLSSDGIVWRLGDLVT